MVWAMRDAFEKEPEEAWEKEYHVMAAAQWVLWNSQAFFESAFCPGIICGANDTVLAFGNLYKGSEDPFCLERWHFWKDGFDEVVGKDEYGKECKDLASRAHSLMDAIEKSLSF